VKRLTVALVPASLLALVLAGGFFARLRWATTLWPWPTSSLSYAFIASFLAAIAISTLWTALGGELAAIRAGALDLTVMYGGMLVYVLTLLGDRRQPRLWPYAIVFGLAFAGSAAAFGSTRRLTWVGDQAMPGPVRTSFAVFALILVVAGTALLFHVDIFPWRLGSETSVMFGCAFLGSGVYFICGCVEPRWSNATGQLAGFLAYDLILLGPLFDHFRDARGGHLLSLIAYVCFLLYSAILAAYYLFIAPSTRLRLVPARPGGVADRR
jgi:hypothetical protein